MPEVMNDQLHRSFEIDGPKYGEDGGGRFTTVGFEWDLLKTVVEDNPLTGLSHVELAESDFRWNALPFLLETDAGNVVELVTPPFFVVTKSLGSAVPDPDDLIAIKDAMKVELGALVRPAKTLGDLVRSNWRSFAINRWRPRALTVEQPGGDKAAISWRNWSSKAARGDTLGAEVTGVDAIPIAKALVEEPQINIALDVASYEALESPDASRLGTGKDADQYQGLVAELSALVSDRAGESDQATRRGRGRGAKQGQRSKKKGASAPRQERPLHDTPNIHIFYKQLIRVLAQQSAIPFIRSLRKQLKKGMETGTVKPVTLERDAAAASFVKDRSNVWMKTDLFNFGVSTLDAKEWSVVLGDLTRIRKRVADSTFKNVNKNHAQPVREGMLGVIDTVAGFGARVGEGGDESVLSEIWKEQGPRPELWEHRPSIPGVRPDTFIAPDKMVALTKRLKLGPKSLQVVEVREPTSLFRWLGVDSPTAKKDDSEREASRERTDASPAEADLTESPPLASVDAEAYAQTIAFFRQSVGAMEDLDGGRGRIFTDYPLTPEQIPRIEGRQVLPTHPDGDCSINAVLESLGEKTPVNELRARIANYALGEGLVTRAQADSILQPGYWFHSDVMLRALAELLETRIEIVDSSGNDLPAIAGQTVKHVVTLFHVPGKIGHFYGSQAT